MHVEMRPLSAIQPYDNNPRHNDGAIEAVAASIRAYGMSDEERWLPVPGYEGLYEVSSHGRVRRASKSRMAPAGHVLKPRVTRAGYLQYGLCRRQRYWHVTGHRLVALAFLGPPPFPRAHVAHYDGDKANNRLSNLRWATPAENEADKRRHGVHSGARPGEQHHGAKLTAEVVKALRRLAATGESIPAIARRLGVAMLTAYDAIHGTTWRTVTEPPPLPRRGKGRVSCKVELIELSRLIPYENNPRCNDAAVEAVARSIQAYSWRVPIVCDEAMVILAGHTRYKAALKLGLTEVPVHVAVGLTPEQAKAYRIADNATATLSTWDDERLTKELLALQSAGFDVELTGLSADELLSLLQPDAAPGLTDPDDIPQPPDEAVTKPGDLWLLGEHRLLCGDSAKVEDVDRLLDGASVQLVNTDPPYNVKVEPRSNNAIAAGLSSFPGTTHHQKLDVKRHPQKAKPTTKKLRAKDRPLANDFVSEEEFDRLLGAWFGHLARALEPGRAAYIWGGYSNIGNYPRALKASGLYFSQAIIWHKQHPVLTRKDFLGDHEWCFYSWREGAAHQFFGPNNVTDVWSVKKVNPQSMVHLTEKPVELAARAIQYSSRPGERVLDLFGGSGSTLIACEQLGRQGLLMEIDPLYCEVIIQRFVRFVGQPGRARLLREGEEVGYETVFAVRGGEATR